jgi:GTP-binding protein EngB required for normal cell division
MGGLNEAQASHVRTTFVHLDTLLESVEGASRTAQSPLSDVRADVPPDAVRLLESYIATARARMLAALDRLGIARPQPKVAAHWRIETTLQFADVALSELDALRGYGAVDPAAAAEVAALAADLRELVRRASEVVAGEESGGLASRIATLPGSVGDVLRGLERLSAERGLAEVRPLLAAAVERATDSSFAVGVFGRVSAGKSSLINALAQTLALPVGVTPVTAVPLRIRRGESGAVVSFLRGEPRAIELARIAEFATEEHNPSNHLAVRAIDVTVPTVPQELEFLDTPGVGSLGTSGPAQAFAWLPRCDLGIVLVAAGSAVARDDFALVSGFRHAGIEHRVLVSKSDLIRAAELPKALAYVEHELRTAGGLEAGLAVTAVSTAADRRDSLDQLRRDVLEPLAADHERRARRAMVARLRALISACASALAGRGGATEDRRVALARRRLSASREIRRSSDHLRSLAPVALDVAADAAAAEWRSGGGARAAVRLVLLEAAGQQLTAVRETVLAARSGAALTQPSAQQPRLPPLFDPPLLDALPPMQKPPLTPQALLRRAARRQLMDLQGELDAAFTRYATRLEAWGNGLLDDLSVESWAAAPDAPEVTDPELVRLAGIVDGWERPG